MGTMKLLLNLRDVKHSLPKLSSRLGDMDPDQLGGAAGKRGPQI